MSMGVTLTRRDALFQTSRFVGLYFIHHDNEERPRRLLFRLLIQESHTSTD